MCSDQAELGWTHSHTSALLYSRIYRGMRTGHIKRAQGALTSDVGQALGFHSTQQRWSSGPGQGSSVCYMMRREQGAEEAVASSDPHCAGGGSQASCSLSWPSRWAASRTFELVTRTRWAASDTCAELTPDRVTPTGEKSYLASEDCSFMVGHLT